MVVTRSMSQKNKRTIDIKDAEEFDPKDGWVVCKMTLADEALIIYIQEAGNEFHKTHPTKCMPKELSSAVQAKWHAMTRSEKAPYLKLAREKRAEEVERYRKWKNGELY